MGRVYKVQNIISQRVEAMKVLLANLEEKPELLERFLREIRVLGSLDHPHIAGLHTAQRSGNQILMLMEFVEGESLDKIMRRGKLPLCDVLRITKQTLVALAFAHKDKVVHRDIKPGNILVTPKGDAKLTDFGIAFAQRDERLTRTGMSMGSLFYMSPEQINGDPNLDGRSDIYSMGIVLYELVTGKRPFQGDTDYSILTAHLNQIPTPPVELDPNTPTMLSQIIMTALAKDPGLRFQSADAMRAALDHAVPLEGVTQTVAAPQAAPQRAAPPPPVGGNAAPVQQQAAPQPAVMKQGSGRRLLWLLAGSLATIAVLVLAATQLPMFRRTAANADESSTSKQAEKAQPPSNPAKEQPSVEQPPAQVTAGQQPVSVQSTTANPSVGLPKIPSTGVQVSQGKRSAGATDAARPPLTTQVTPATLNPQGDPQRATQPPTQNPDPPNVPDTGRSRTSSPALEAQQQRMVDLAIRAGAIRRSLDNLRRAQARSGLGLRRDFEMAEQRLIFQMDEAEAAIKAGDAAAAEKHLDGAEAPLKLLENNLGK
jgi:serine/threonine-protein kinase